MPNCSPNTLAIGRSSTNGSTNCGNGVINSGANNCGSGVIVNGPNCNSNGGYSDAAVCCDINQIGPRHKRDKVRQQLQDYILLSLGAPVVDVELDIQQIELAIDRALQIFEDYAPREFYTYYTFNTTPGKSVYTMPPEVGYIRNVFYKQEPNFAFQASDLDGAIPIEYFYPGGAYSSIQGGLIDPVQPIWGRMGEWTLYKQYEMMYSNISSNIGGWEWVDGYRNIKIYPVPCKAQHVIVHYLQKCKDWDCVNEAMQNGALAHAKIYLGRIRGKYTNIPGVDGGIQLDGQQLLMEGREELELWKRELLDRFGDILPITLG